MYQDFIEYLHKFIEPEEIIFCFVALLALYISYLIYSYMEKKFHKWEVIYDKVKNGQQLNEREQKIWNEYQESLKN